MKPLTPSHCRDTKSTSLKVRPKPNLQSKIGTIVNELDYLKDHVINETNTIDNLELKTKKKTEKFKKQLISLRTNLDDLQLTMNKEMELNYGHFQDLVEQIEHKNELNVKRLELQIQQMEVKYRKQMESVIHEQQQQNQEIRNLKERESQNTRYLEGIIKQNTENISMDIDKILSQINEISDQQDHSHSSVQVQKQQLQDLQTQLGCFKNSSSQQQSTLNQLQQEHNQYGSSLQHFEQRNRSQNESLQEELNKIDRINRTLEQKMVEMNNSLLSELQSTQQGLGYDLGGLRKTVDKEIESMDYKVNRVQVQVEDQGKKLLKDIELKHQDNKYQQQTINLRINEVNDILQQSRDSLKHEIRLLKQRQPDDSAVPQFRRYEVLYHRRQKMNKYSEQQVALAQKIQKLWRQYVDKKIYLFYKQIINFRLKGNPSQLLKAINPCEAQLLDASMNSIIRFRLGGEKFPPNIYYKIFSVKGVCDLNSYAPRDYSSLKGEGNVQRMSYDNYKSNRTSIEQEGWYLRVDNNGWRPISDKYLGKPDFIQIFSANKVKYYHHKKQKRQEKCQKKVRMNKIRWLQKLYLDKEKTEEEQNYFITNNPFDDPKYMNLNNQQFEEEVNELVEWSQNLDYDSYLNNWFQVATSNVTMVQGENNNDTLIGLNKTQYQKT